jgi:P-type Cu+ transporter
MTEVRSVTMPVTGMTCANCAATIERNVRKLPGVNEANVNLASEKLTVAFDPGQLDEHGIIARVQRVGYGVAIGKAELPITGLRDNSDAVSLEKALAKQAGVLAASVSYGTERAALEYIPGLTSIADLAVVIRKAGFDLVQVGETEELEDVEGKVRAHEVNRQRRLLVVGLALTVPLVTFSMARDFGLVTLGSPSLDRLAMLIPATLVQFIVGWQYYVGAFKSLRAGGANMDVLIALGSSVAYFYSVGVTAGLIPSPNVYFETGAAIITLIMLGKYLEARAKGQTSQALKALMGLRPKTAHVVRQGVETEISIEQVEVGDTVVVRPGEKVPVDGIISEGRSALDESMITGESMPVSKGLGEEVIGATINKEGLIKFEATKVGKNTTLAQIVRMVQEAQGSKAPIQKLADQISGYFVPTVIGIALATFAAWLFIARADWTGAMINAVAVLVIACPCALGLATPTAIMVGTTKSAENGILFKNSETLQRAGRVNIVVLDKTGTITRGEPEVTDIVPAAGTTADEVLRLAASAERGSEHPLGRAIAKLGQDRRLRLVEPLQFRAVSGFGIRATLEDQAVVIGNPRLMKNEGIDLAPLEPDILRLQAEGKTAMIVAASSAAGEGALRPIGLVAVADTVKPGSKEAIAEMRQLGLDVVMITGDNQRTAEAIAKQVGITRVLAEVLPGDKAAEVKKLQTAGSGAAQSSRARVAMVGDGINDAPALVQADVGIAIGTGTDVAMAAAGITLISGDLRGVGRAISVSRGTLQTIIQNLFWAFFYNVALIPIAALGLLIPMIAAGAMAFSSIFVVTNSLRLRGYKVQTLAAPKPLWRQLVELTPHLVLPALTLAILVAVSVGWLRPAGMKPSGGMASGPVTYQAFIRPDPASPVAPGTLSPIDIIIADQVNKRFTLNVDLGANPGINVTMTDQYGTPFTNFDPSVRGREIVVAVVRRNLTSLYATSVLANTTSSGGGGGGMMGGPKPAAQAGPAANSVRPDILVPAEGQYVVFVDFWPAGGDKVTVAAPLTVGSGDTPPPSLTPDAVLVQAAGDLNLALKTNGPLVAKRPLVLSFEVTDPQGQLQTDALQAKSATYLHLDIVDEKLTTFLRPDFVNRHRLEFAVSFPKAGRYKAWLTFRYANQANQVAYVFDVR